MFITFEGIEGSGKSLQIAQAATHLKKRGIPYLLTREPGGTQFGMALREVLLKPDGVQREPWAELLLYLADRHQHLKELIEPALKQGQVVLCDRYHDATRAYQGAARGISQEEIEKAAQLLGILEPDQTILLDIDPEAGLSRARRRNSLDPSAAAEGRFEEEDISFHTRVRMAYLDLAARFPQRIHIVPASESPDRVSQLISALLDQWLDRTHS
jgi:dTMP kinase